MTTKRIDELTAATELTGDDLLPIMDGAATTKKITAANARTYMAAASDPVGTAAAAVVAHAGAADPHGDRAYTDAQVAAFLSTAFDFKASVRAATTASITLSGAQTIDGVAVVAGDRVLVKNQATGSQNGIYVAAAGAWSRSTDADANAEVTAGLSVPVEEGTVNGGRVFLLTTANPITVGTTALSFSLVDAGDLRASNNLSDLTSASTARTNLGLGTAATTAATDYAAASHNQAASTITSGTLDTARLGSGSASASTYLRGDQTWATVAGGGGYAIFGDGSDGTVTISGTTTLTRDMFYDVLTVQNGGVLNTANYRVFCKTSCTVDAGGAIRCDGGNGTDSTRWGGSAAGTGSTYYGLSSLGASASSGASNGAAGDNQGTCLGGSGGAGGGAGAYTGGAGGVATAPVASLGGFRSLIQALQSKALSYGGTTQLTAGCGGGSGATNTQVGGGGGAGGGILVLAAKAITNNGSISADGGRGSNNSALANSGGGGGGGGGGVVFAIFDTYAGTDPTAAGGAAGTHAAGGGTDGSAGSAGTVIKLANA